MTKVTILGEEPKEKKKKPIEFVKYLNMSTLMFKKNNHNEATLPTEWENIELITRNFLGIGLDLMFAYDGNRNEYHTHCLFLGHFNDGIVK